MTAAQDRPHLLITAPMMPFVMEALEREYVTHRLWEQPDRDAYLHLRREQQPDDAPAARLLDALVLTDAPAAYFPAVAETLFPEAALPDAP